MTGRVWIGTSGWLYPPWRGTFYPKGLPQRRELEYLSRQVGSIEINGSFYSLQRPESYRRWRDETPEDFVFSVKGPRFITHMKRLKDSDTPLANFFASGVLALGAKLGPVLWQLPENFKYEPDVLAEFFHALPRTTEEAAALAKRHDERMDGRQWTETDADRPLRHAMEVRNPAFANREFVDLLRDNNIALVVADTAGRWPYLDDVTADFVYVRLHGDKELYASGYTDSALDSWAKKVKKWRRAGDVYVYFDNDMKVKAPGDAQSLARRVTKSGK
ncbi:DUF72 domain-containing protein [Actinokineospora iranica]|uniref:Uncharacterized conserved protein YecE, DUF72 family n=1 Tax=Actinokineospora iranica TaxID=1271860 RepID=A0A1G6LN19_9PSEU|nr:DUF72 domain-containing protein [Actinokineospora iranica]SDC44544.1 Uncharacterized conserved protein YecE, DUF72 family [Actinokineospora iranica]